MRPVLSPETFDRFSSCLHGTRCDYGRQCPEASQRAIEASVYVVRAFVKMSLEVLASHKDLVWRLDEMEGEVDPQFKVVFDAIRALMEPPVKPRRRIGN